MAKEEQPTIAIVGGGLAGLTLSIGLTCHEVSHHIYESASAFAEIGKGIALGPNSISALELIDPRVRVGLKSCITYNEGLNGEGEGVGKDEWMDVRYEDEESFNSLITTVSHSGHKPARAAFHWAKFLEELIKLVSPSTVSFNKSLISISEDTSTTPLTLHFSDGSTATANCIIACDGIKSVARSSYVLSNPQNPAILHPVFANEFAYRGMFSRARFLELTENTIEAGKGTIFCGPNSYVVMYPIEKGRLMNMVAVKHVSPDSESNVQHEKNWIQAVNPETMLDDFKAWGKQIKTLLANVEKPERWALYDHLSAPTYVKGRVALMGDSAHASTPHQGQGAGMAFEDSLVLSGILGAVLKEAHAEQGSEGDTNARLEACLRAYDEVRRPRTQEVTRTSREMGVVIECLKDGLESDVGKLKENLDLRMNWIWDVDLPGEIERGIEIAKRELKKLSQTLKRYSVPVVPTE